jgi:peptide/nickel transport system permease protein
VGSAFARRAIQSVIVLAVVLLVVFFIFYVLGDPTDLLVPETATNAQRAAFSHAHGFDDPIWMQLGRFLGGVVTLDFGTSYSQSVPAMPLVLKALPNTLILAASAFVLAAVGGVLIGALGAFNEGRAIDRVTTFFATAISSLAEFWVGLLLIVLISVQLGALPTSGFGFPKPLILPAITVALAPMGRIAFVTRTNALSTLRSPHVLAARARGNGRFVLMTRHVLRNVAVPTIALCAVEVTGMVVGGSTVVETVFAWPGMGRLFVTSMQTYDLPVVSSILVIGAVFVLILNIVIDNVYAALDPRVRYE